MTEPEEVPDETQRVERLQRLYFRHPRRSDDVAQDHAHLSQASHAAGSPTRRFPRSLSLATHRYLSSAATGETPAARPSSELAAWRQAVGTAALAAALLAPAAGQPRRPGTVRIATFNIFELSCAKILAVDSAGNFGHHAQVRKAAEILRRVQPDIVLINEIDYSSDRDCVGHFAEAYLASDRTPLVPLLLPHVVYGAVNTGVPSGLDLNSNGRTDDPEDAFGFGRYPGRYGMALLSRYPIERAAIRTFQRFLWKDMPGHLMPDGRGARPAHYSDVAAARVRLSSKSHWDVPVRIGGRVVHLLAAHPTPPIFDGDEDVNGRRNFDEIRLWADYVTGSPRADYVVDDAGRRGGLPAGASFVLLGDFNADPLDDLAYGRRAITQLLEHPRVQDPKPVSDGEWDAPRPYPGESRSRTTSTAAWTTSCRAATCGWSAPASGIRRARTRCAAS